jgi:hypothetical protein
VASTPFIQSIDVEDGAQLGLNGNTVNVSRNIDARTSGSIVGGTINVPSGSNGGTMRGALPSVACQSGQYTLSGVTQLSGSLSLTNCSLDVHGQTLTIAQSLSTSSGAGLTMSQASTVTVNGNASFLGGTMTLTAGNLVVAGNFTQSNGTFAPSGSHTVTLGAGGAQSQGVTFDDVTNSWFQNLNVSLVSGKTVTINSAVKVKGAMSVVASTGGTLSLPNGLENQLNGPITISGTMGINLGETINTSSLKLSGGTITLIGSGVLALGNGTLALGDNLDLIVNVTGGLVGSAPAQCTHGANVTISGTNGPAVAALKQLCGIQ